MSAMHRNTVVWCASKALDAIHRSLSELSEDAIAEEMKHADNTSAYMLGFRVGYDDAFRYVSRTVAQLEDEWGTSEAWSSFQHSLENYASDQLMVALYSDDAPNECFFRGKTDGFSDGAMEVLQSWSSGIVLG